MTIEKRSSLFILAACFLWATDLLVRYPITLKMGYTSIVLIESFIGVVFLLPWFFKNGIRELRLFSLTDWGLSAFLGAVGMTAAGLLFTFCIQKASPSTFSFFQIFQPLFVVYLAHRFLKEKSDNLYFFWGIWVIVSALLMYSQDIELSLIGGDLLSYPLETIIALGVMMIWGLCTIAAKKLLVKHSATSIVGVRWFFAFVAALGFNVFYQTETTPWTIVFETDYVWRFFYISVVAGLCSMAFYYSGLKKMEVGKVSFIELAYPALGMIFSAIYTFEQLTFLQAIGATSFVIFITLMISGRQFLPLLSSTKIQQSRNLS
ncbi:MAG: DMT family transporter [Bacteriovoracaceae bacterium]